MDNEIKNYRSSLVTAIGIILWFVLWFAATRATQTVTQTDRTDSFIAICLLISVVLQIIALYRILDNSFPQDKQWIYYKKTLNIFIIWLSIAFFGIIAVILQWIL